MQRGYIVVAKSGELRDHDACTSAVKVAQAVPSARWGLVLCD